MVYQNFIRNFCIIAHVDHGKSTLADRFLEITETVPKRNLIEQTLDAHPISRQRGITIRLAPVTMNHQFYQLNLIDTPGHVDFSYEVERSLAACEGAILLVDATQGIQAQTLSHFQKAQQLGLTIIPAINKIDLPNARVKEVEQEVNELLKDGDSRTRINLLSARTGQGVPELLEAVVNIVPPPSGNLSAPTRALIFSSQYDPRRGVVAFIRVVDGEISPKDNLRFLASGANGIALEIGHFTPQMTPTETLSPGEVGYVITNVKNPSLVRVGDTLTELDQLDKLVPLPGYRPVRPMVFVSFFPVDQNDFPLLEGALVKLKLNDAALVFSRTDSKALGRGFRVGFLGHLHAEVTQERLERDFGLAAIATTPTVEYRIMNQELGENDLHNSKFLIPNSCLEPWVRATILTPQSFVGAVVPLCENRRGKMTNLTYHGSNVSLEYELPLAEIITDFFDRLKSATAGFGSYDYELLDFRPFAAVKLTILINHQEIDALSQLVDQSKAVSLGRLIVEKLKAAIPHQQIPIAIQASVNGQIIARGDIPTFRKDVTAKLYGGDRTRRMKLLEKQKKGKEKMLALGKVTIPNDVFLKIFKT